MQERAVTLHLSFPFPSYKVTDEVFFILKLAIYLLEHEEIGDQKNLLLAVCFIAHIPFQ